MYVCMYVCMYACMHGPTYYHSADDEDLGLAHPSKANNAISIELLRHSLQRIYKRTSEMGPYIHRYIQFHSYVHTYIHDNMHTLHNICDALCLGVKLAHAVEVFGFQSKLEMKLRQVPILTVSYIYTYIHTYILTSEKAVMYNK